MRKTSKKLLALLLSLTMVLTLAACGAKTPADPDGGGSTVAPTAAPATPTDVPATPTPVPDKFEAFDFGGRTIKVGTWFDVYYTSDHQAITDNPGLGDTVTAQLQLDNVRRVEKKYNCKIQFVNLTWAGIMSSINTSIAAGTPECDIYMVDLQFGFPAVFNNLAQELSAIAPENCDLFGDQQVLKPLVMGSYDGTYLFTEQGLPTTGIYLGYNATMIQDLGLEDPQELWENGQWTFDKFAEMCAAGTKDTNNDGTTDVYGYGGIWTDFTQGMILNNGGTLAGTPVEGLDSKPAVEVFELYNRIYNVDMSARPWNEADWDDNNFAWADGKVMFWTAQSWGLKAKADEAIAAGSEIPFEYHIVPYPKGPSKTDDKPVSPFLGNWYMIPVGVKDPGKVLQIFEEYKNWHKGDVELRDDPTYFESNFLSQKDVDIAIQCSSTTVFDPWNCLSPYFDMGGAIWWPIVVRHDTTVAQAAEAGKATLQNALDNLVYKKK